MRTDKPRPKYQGIKFHGNTWTDSIEQLMTWLNQTAHARIHLQNLGFAVGQMWLAKSGEILHTDFNRSVYIGGFVDMETLSTGNPMTIFIQDQFATWVTFSKMVPKEIKLINNKASV